MSRVDLDDIISSIPEMDLSELRTLEAAVRVAVQMHGQSLLSTDRELRVAKREDEGPGLDEQARGVLTATDSHQLTQGDQALLAAVILAEGYQQSVFSSRDINDVIEESGAGRVGHITSTIRTLMTRDFLTGSTKALSLSPEGKAKARGLIGMIQRRAA